VLLSLKVLSFCEFINSPTATQEARPDKTLQELHDDLRVLQEQVNTIRNAIRYYKDDKKKRVLVLGAGRSATAAINYFLQHAPTENWLVRVGDADLALSESKVSWLISVHNT
jgi:hypothetical protein